MKPPRAKNGKRLVPAETRTAPPPGLPDEMEQQRNLVEMQNEELRKAHANLEISHQRFLELHEQAPMGYLTFDAHGCIREINAAATTLLGVKRACGIGKPFVVYVEKADRKKFLDHLWTVRRAGATVATDLRLAARNGTVTQVQMTTGRLHDAEGRAGLFLSAIEDVTALRAGSVNTAYLASIVESSQDGIISYSLDEVIQSWNPGAQKLLGYSPAEIIGKHISVIVPDEQRAEFERNLLTAKSGTTVVPHETLRRRKDGSLVAMELTISPIMDGDRVVAVTAIGHDISERKRAEAALHESREKLQLAIAGADLGTWDWDLVNNRLMWDGRCKAMAGLPPDAETSYGVFMSTMHPDDRERANAVAMRAIETRVESEVEYRTVWPDGSVHWVVARGRATADETGRPVRFSGVTLDITERKHAEKALRESEERFRALVTATSEVLYRMSPDWREVLEVHSRKNPRANTETPNRNWLDDYILPEEWPRVMAAIAEATRNKGTFELEHRIRRMDGTLGWAVSRSIPLKDANGEITEWFGASSDVTERKEAEELIRKLNAELEKRVAARTAALQGSNEALKQAMEDRVRLEEEVIAVSEAERERIARDLHDDLGQQLAGIWCLSLAMQKNLASQSSPETATATRIADYLSKSLALTRGLARGLHPVVSDPKGLVSALTELAGRSSELFKAQCRLTVRQRVRIHDPAMATHLYRIAQEAVSNACRHGHAKHVTITLSYSRGRLMLSVGDDGKGLPKHDRKHTGMGMRIMNYRADVIGGTLVFRRRPAGGTMVTFTISTTAASALQTKK